MTTPPAVPLLPCPMAITDSRTSRFWKMVAVGKQNECWEWKGYKLRKRGHFWDGKSVTLAARYSFVLHGLDLPTGMQVCHWCNNPACVNPRHLYAATSRDNTRYAAFCGLLPEQNKTHCKNGHEYSESNTFYRKDGARECRICRVSNHRKSYRSMRGALAVMGER